ncbi:MAG: hypothetical protein ABI434_20090 [Burkholderiaceae bacterium]
MWDATGEAHEIALSHHFVRGADGKFDAAFQALHGQFADHIVQGHFLASEQNEAKYLQVLRLVKRGSLGGGDSAAKRPNVDPLTGRRMMDGHVFEAPGCILRSMTMKRLCATEQMSENCKSRSIWSQGLHEPSASGGSHNRLANFCCSQA